MLAVFHPTVASPPEEIIVGEASAQTDGFGIVNAYKKAHVSAITIEFGKRCAMAYCHDQQELLKPRYLAVVDDIFCMFVGTLENLSALRQQYGITKSVTEVNLIIEIYRAMRDRSPYPSDHVMRGLAGSFSFVLFDNTTQSIFVGVDSQGKIPFYWGTGTDGALAFSDDPAILKHTCGKTFSPFPRGCFFSSSEGLQSFEHPLQRLKAMPRVDSQGQVCGTTFKVEPAPKKKETVRAYSFPRVGSESWGLCE
jgi:asparagine synthetase B (glutamine-hydrolysing)